MNNDYHNKHYVLFKPISLYPPKDLKYLNANLTEEGLIGIIRPNYIVLNPSSNLDQKYLVSKLEPLPWEYVPKIRILYELDPSETIKLYSKWLIIENYIQGNIVHPL